MLLHWVFNSAFNWC